MSVVDQMGWDEEKQKRCKNYLTPEYTSSDESEVSEDETGPDEETHHKEAGLGKSKAERAEGPS